MGRGPHKEIQVQQKPGEEKHQYTIHFIHRMMNEITAQITT